MDIEQSKNKIEIRVYWQPGEKDEKKIRYNHSLNEETATLDDLYTAQWCLKKVMDQFEIMIMAKQNDLGEEIRKLTK